MPQRTGVQTVLIIDRDATNRMTLSRALRSAQVETIEASSIPAGIALSESGLPHLIIAELQAPERTGLELLKLKRISPFLRNTPIILMSRLSDRETILQVLGGGASDYLVKPFSTASLIQKVKKALRDRKELSRTITQKSHSIALGYFSATLKEVHSTQLTIESPIKLGTGEQIQLLGHWIENIGLHRCAFTVHDSQSSRADFHQFTQNINVIGIHEPITRTLRRQVEP